MAHIGDSLAFNVKGRSITHYLTRFENGKAIFKTYEEIHHDTACRGCRYFFRERGWIKRERVKPDAKMPTTMACNLGQFRITHDIWRLPCKCKIKNLVNGCRAEIKSHIMQMLNGLTFHFDAKHIIEPTLYGMHAIDVDNLILVPYLLPAEGKIRDDE